MGHKRNHNLELIDEHYTPLWVFEALAVEFDLDVAAAMDITKSNVPAKHWFNEETNGLEQEWFGNVWMNPPYSKMTPWANKFREHKQGIAIMPVSRSRWFEAMWQEADGITITPHNLKFDRVNEKPKTIAFQTVIVAFGKENVEALKRLEFKVR